jgi:hypothetical protein
MASEDQHNLARAEKSFEGKNGPSDWKTEIGSPAFFQSTFGSAEFATGDPEKVRTPNSILGIGIGAEPDCACKRVMRNDKAKIDMVFLPLEVWTQQERIVSTVLHCSKFFFSRSPSLPFRMNASPFLAYDGLRANVHLL